MAIPLANDLPSLPQCFFSFPSYSKSRTLLLRRPPNSKPKQGSPLVYLPPPTVNTRASFVASAYHQSSPPANSGEADVNTLISAYRQALFDGDQVTVSAIETAICEIEKQKKRMDQKVLSLSMKIASEKETRIRLQADFDNTRKRMERERLSTESNAKVHIMKSLLPVVDSFERARQQIKPDTETEKKIDTSYQGIYRQLVEVLRRLHVKPIATVGKPFDPLLHEAISREESEAVKAGVVTEELNRGFLLEERVLRPAKVIVSLGPIKKKMP